MGLLWAFMYQIKYKNEFLKNSENIQKKGGWARQVCYG